ncbi:MAG: hypothetical protein R2856_32145 [Caldilineaceae bacterium]
MDRRTFLHALGVGSLGASTGWADGPAQSTDQQIYLPAVMGSGAGSMSLLVAAADAPDAIREQAHYQCDGVDDHVTINQAVDDLGATGGQVQLSEGTFVCASGVRLRRRVRLAGKGRATVLRAAGTWAAHDGSSPGALIEPFDVGIDKTSVVSLALDGNRYGGADVQGVYYNITTNANFDEGPDAGHTFDDLYIFQTRQHGFHITGSRMRASKISRIRVYNVGEEGVTVAHGFLIDCPDGFVSECESGSSSGSGFYVDGTNNHFVNCKSWYSDLSGWQIRKPRGQYAACEAQDNQEHGFYITTGPVSLVGCHADSNSWHGDTPAADFDGFHIPWGNRIQLIGCSAYDKNEGQRGNWQRYGFFVGSSATSCQIIGSAADNAVDAVGGSGATSAANLVMVTANT